MTRDTLFGYLTFGLKEKNFYDVTPLFEPRVYDAARAGVFENMFLKQTEFFDKLTARLYSKSGQLSTSDYVELFGENSRITASDFQDVVDQYCSYLKGSVVETVGVFQEIVRLYESEISSLVEESSSEDVVITASSIKDEFSKVNSTLNAICETLQDLSLADVLTQVSGDMSLMKNEMFERLDQHSSAINNQVTERLAEIKALNDNVATKISAVLKSCSVAEDAVTQVRLMIAEISNGMSNLVSEMSVVITAVSGSSKPECRFNLELLKNVEDQLVNLRAAVNSLIEANVGVSNDVLSVKKTVVASAAVSTTAMLIGEVATK